VKAGKETIGGPLVDPAVDEDIESLIGNVEPDQVVRALVRYSIKKSEDKPQAELKDTPQPPSARRRSSSRPRAGAEAPPTANVAIASIVDIT
jgi:phospholipid/cholesterol/gamma-HCH transport system substrate-binding protein